jgi:hypothetical protein
MAVVIEYKNGIFYVNSQRVTFPKDAQHQSAQIMMGLDYDTGDIRPIAATPGGRFLIDGSPLGSINMKAVYTYYGAGPGIGKTQTIKEYPTGAAAGTPAKLTTYTYNIAGKVETIEETDTVV